jgi:dTDP-glucose 4,6-dehydratase
LKPSNPYSATKAAADQLILAWNRTYGVPYVIVRPTNNYGIGQYVEKLIPKTCKFVSLGRKIPLHDKGTPIRVWLHAKDTASAIIRIIETGSVNEIYNIAGSYEQENIETVKKILNLYFEGKEVNYEKHIDFTADRVGQDLRYSIDDSKLQSIGWKSEHNFDLELPEIVQYYKNNFVW